jgi:Ni/Co efflux regulator RcnB
MSHASYLFLCKLHLSEPEDEIVLGAEGEFDEWAEHATDENNWSQHEALVLRDGRVLAMCPEGDWRGREELQQGLLTEMAQDKRWDWAMRHALDCVVTDLGVFELQKIALFEPTPDEKKEEARLDAMTFADLLAHTHETACKRLSAEYEWARGQPRRPELRDKDWIRDYRRRKLSRGYEILRGCHTQPFTDDGVVTPYEYRAFDLTGSKDEYNAILITDIHT